jgi:hypothetical protein
MSRSIDEEIEEWLEILNECDDNSQAAAIMEQVRKLEEKKAKQVATKAKSMGKFFTVIFITLAALAALFISAPVQAQSDTSEPVVLDLTFEPKVVNTALGDEHITVTTRIVSSAGVYSANVELATNVQVFNILFNESNRIAGNEFDGIYQAVFTVEKYSPVGKWNVQTVATQDGAGNFGYALPLSTCTENCLSATNETGLVHTGVAFYYLPPLVEAVNMGY